MDDRDRLMTARTVKKVAQISYRQLDHWCREKRLTPFKDATNGSGDARRFLFTDAVVAATLGHWQRTFHSIPMDLPDEFEARVRGRIGEESPPPLILNCPPFMVMIDIKAIENDCRERLPQPAPVVTIVP